MLSGNAFRHQIVLPEQQAFYDYWRTKCRENTLPSRHDILPEDITAQLPMTTLTELCPEEGERRYKFRLAGTGFWNLYESEIQGQYLDDLPIGCRVQYWTRILNKIVETKRPFVGVTKPNTPNGAHMVQFWVRLPLSDNGRDINMILGYDHLMKLSDIKTTEPLQRKMRA